MKESLIEHEVRIRMLEESIGKLDEKIEHLEDKVDDQFKWIVGSALACLGGIGLHLMGWM